MGCWEAWDAFEVRAEHTETKEDSPVISIHAASSATRGFMV